MVSHNLRAPLVNIMGLSEVICEDMGLDDLKFTVNSIKKCAYQLDKVVSDINSVLNVKTENAEVKSSFHLEDMIKDLSERFRKEGKNKHRILIDCSQLNEIYAVTEYMESILYSLVSRIIDKNGERYFSDIRIWTVKRESHYELHIAENRSQGSHKKPIDSMLRKNSKLRSKEKPADLLMVQSQVLQLGGDINLGDINNGSEFIIILPLDEKI
jgi:K+-sensing histidine kinase KdpD